MRHTVTLTEAFDHPFPYRWTLTRDMRYAAEFRLPDNTQYIFQFTDYADTDTWEVTFGREVDDDPEGRTYAKRYGIVDLGNAGTVQRVFATCIAIMADFVTRVQPRALEFTAENDEPSRVKLYTQMLKLIPRHLTGYRAEPPYNGGTATQFRIVNTHLREATDGTLHVDTSDQSTTPFYFSPGFNGALKQRILTTPFPNPTLACQHESRRWALRLLSWGIDDVAVVGGFFTDDDADEGHTWVEVDGSIFDPTVDQFHATPDEDLYTETERYEDEDEIRGMFD